MKNCIALYVQNQDKLQLWKTLHRGDFLEIKVANNVYLFYI